ncbi:hypothetical protein GCM10010472_72180 [Pseudonocardia halophobica]|uniref:Uncharacterized protein n=1 Tax=Pseudonocardia halophobica TaxID=29401 RepID=A0A9W6L2I6_9PSEU|nr:hypothetical protein GCM10017577_20510 [Pseudonocardia halophobica]
MPKTVSHPIDSSERTRDWAPVTCSGPDRGPGTTSGRWPGAPFWRPAGTPARPGGGAGLGPGVPGRGVAVVICAASLLSVPMISVVSGAPWT